MRKLKRKFAKPIKPWDKQRIIDEKGLIKDYAYKNKKDIWKMKSKVSRLRAFAKKLVSISNEQEVKERDEFLKSLYVKGLIKEDSSVEDVLALTVRDISERRLQTLVFRQGLTQTPRQARQFIVHGHVFVNGNKITVPSALISRKEEGLIKIIGVQVNRSKKANGKR